MSIKVARRTIQALGIIFIFAVPLLNKNGVTFVTGTLYSLAVGPVWITDPLIGAQTVLTTRSVDLTLILSIIIPLLVALASGRVFCGWFCPQNTVSETTDKLAAKLKIRRVFRQVRSPVPRYLVLGGVLVFSMAARLPLASLLSAPGILSAQAAKIVYEGAVGAEMGLVGMIVLAEIFVSRRLWCNGLCPVGAFLGLLRLPRTMRVAFTEDTGHVCGRCHNCAEVCQLGLNPLKGGIAPLCHNCGDCIDACASIDTEKRPLSFRFSGARTRLQGGAYDELNCR